LIVLEIQVFVAVSQTPVLIECTGKFERLKKINFKP